MAHRSRRSRSKAMPRLRVLAGPNPSSLVSISKIVNTDKPHTISTDQFEGQIVVNIKGFTDPEGKVLDSEYFNREDRKDITWSIQVQGRFLEHHSSDDILFGNTFDRPLKLPWGSGAALKFMNYIDPTLEHDLGSSTKPWALSPLISTMPHLTHSRLHGSRPSSRASSHSRQGSAEPGNRSTPQHQKTLSVPGANQPKFPTFPPKESIEDDLSHIHLAHSKDPDASDSESDTSSSSESASVSEETEGNEGKPQKERKVKLGSAGPHSLNLHTARQRQSYFHTAKHRQEVSFGRHDILTMDFCYGFLEFSPSLTLRLPGGVSFDLLKYWDGQPVRFACCERNNNSKGDNSEPWGKMFWCVQIELAEEEKTDIGKSEHVEEEARGEVDKGDDLLSDID